LLEKSRDYMYQQGHLLYRVSVYAKYLIEKRKSALKRIMLKYIKIIHAYWSASLEVHGNFFYSKGKNMLPIRPSNDGKERVKIGERRL